MRSSAQSILPYTQEQLFDLVANVDRYAEFIPGCVMTEVNRAGDTIYVEQSLGIGPLLHYRFSSVAALEPPVGIHITSTDGPFSYLEVCWSIDQQEQGGCLVTCSTDFQLRSSMLQKLFDRLFAQITLKLLKAFETRAHQLYMESETS